MVTTVRSCQEARAEHRVAAGTFACDAILPMLLSNLSNSQREFSQHVIESRMSWVRCLQFTTNCCNFSRSERQCAGAKLKKTDEIAMKTVVSVTVECKVAKQKMPKGCLVAAKTRITNHFSSSISMMCIDAGGLRIWSQCIAEDGQPSGTQLIKSTFATNQQSSGRWKEASQMQRTV